MLLHTRLVLLLNDKNALPRGIDMTSVYIIKAVQEKLWQMRSLHAHGWENYVKKTFQTSDDAGIGNKWSILFIIPNEPGNASRQW